MSDPFVRLLRSAARVFLASLIGATLLLLIFEKSFIYYPARTVDVTPRELTAKEDPFLAAALKSAKPRPHWPADYVRNHGHYVSGEPKKT